LKRATQRDMPTLIARLLSGSRTAAGHKQVEHFDDVAAASVTSISEEKDGSPKPFPVQVDGDYIGDRTRVELRAVPGALTIVA
jgi:diacylglycerol kinase family enzyme